MAAPGTDPKTAIILDFIRGGVPGNPSGEADGNYNAVIGNAHASRDLGQLSILQIYGLQGQLRQQGMPSDAVGGYQFIHTTLSGLVAQAKLPLTTLFTPQLQDQLATVLLRGRGYGQWLQSEITDEALAHGLSCEWASLPDPYNGGRSHYDGLAGNHASCTLDAVYAMLKAAAAAGGGTAPVSVPAKVQGAAPAPLDLTITGPDVARLQTALGVTADDVVGPATLAALTAKLGA